jgi:hypothetical protein
MIQQEKLFENFFDDKNIATPRLLNFGSDTLNRLIAQNNPAYDALIKLLTPLVTAMQTQISEVDTALGLQKGTTLTVNQLIELFSTTMKQQEGVIANAVGGFGTPAYIEFYPHGFSEYTNATKTQMATLTDRVNTASTAHAAELGAPLTAKLQAFKTAWDNSRTAQVQQIGSVGGNRNQRNDARTQLETGMLTAVHTIAALYPGDVQQCSALFNFALLFTQPHHKHETYKGTPAAGETLVVINRTLTDSVQLTIRNTSDNAPLAVWLGSNGTSPMPADALTVQPADSASPKPHKLGDLKNTFLLIANTSAVNAGSYEVEVVGSEKG